MLEETLVLCLILFFGYIYFRLFYTPFNLFRDFGDLGFEDVKNAENINTRCAINEVRKRRKTGNLPPPYPNGWFAILESEELIKGSTKEIYALGQNLVAWRGVSGTAYVSDAYCPHLGAHLGVGGQVKGECIQCPFHGWEFDGQCDGKLIRIPYAEKIPEWVKLGMWSVTETNGFIFVWFHTKRELPSWNIDPIPEITERKWSYRGRSEMRVACHIQEIPENGADIAHLNVLHSDSVLGGDDPKRHWKSPKLMRHVWKGTWEANTLPNCGHEGIMKLYHFIRLFNSFSIMHINVFVRQIGPGIVVLNFDTFLGRGIFVQTVTPIKPLLQRVIHRFYSDAWIIHPLAKMILDAEAKQISRDIRIWNRKCFLDKPILIPEDATIKSFRRWFSQFYSRKEEDDKFNYFKKRG